MDWLRFGEKAPFLGDRGLTKYFFRVGLVVVARAISRRVGTAHHPKSWRGKEMGSVGGAHPTKNLGFARREFGFARRWIWVPLALPVPNQGTLAKPVAPRNWVRSARVGFARRGCRLSVWLSRIRKTRLCSKDHHRAGDETRPALFSRGGRWAYRWIRGGPGCLQPGRRSRKRFADRHGRPNLSSLRDPGCKQPGPPTVVPGSPPPCPPPQGGRVMDLQVQQEDKTPSPLVGEGWGGGSLATTETRRNSPGGSRTIVQPLPYSW